MREHPMHFNGEMVRAIIEGRKTQTRRVMKPKPKYLSDMPHDCNGWYWISPKKINGCEQVEAWKNDVVGIEWMQRHCQYGVPGDRLWVRETFCKCEDHICYKAGHFMRKQNGQCFLPTPKGWAPSVHMPRHYSRITLEVTGVRVERLCDISAEDAKAEGMKEPMIASESGYETEMRGQFFDLWDSLAKPGAKWEDNPWVWVIEFRRVENA